MISVADLDIEYSPEAGRTAVALKGFSFDVARGESVAIIGPSGCGKTTLLLAMAGLLQPDSGSIDIDSSPVVGPRRATSLILQNSGLFPWKRADDNAGLGLVLRGMSKTEARVHAAAALERVGIGDFARAYPKELSEGMKQRLALAQAITLEADLLLMDEPLASVDAMTREKLQDYLLSLWKQRGHTQVVVTHSIEEAAFLGGRVYVMSPRPGRVFSVVENPGMGDPSYRQDPQFHEVAAMLREQLSECETSCAASLSGEVV